MVSANDSYIIFPSGTRLSEFQVSGVYALSGSVGSTSGYLPLSGGILTGDLTINESTPAFNLQIGGSDKAVFSVNSLSNTFLTSWDGDMTIRTAASGKALVIQSNNQDLEIKVTSGKKFKVTWV